MLNYAPDRQPLLTVTNQQNELVELLETVCKHILDSAGIPYDANKIELHELYKLTATELNIAPSQHTEEVFKQIRAAALRS